MVWVLQQILVKLILEFDLSETTTAEICQLLEILKKFPVVLPKTFFSNHLEAKCVPGLITI